MIDWQNPFKPEDFDYIPPLGEEITLAQLTADQANARFRELLAQCPKVTRGFSCDDCWHQTPINNYCNKNFQARLTDVKEG